MGDDHFWISIVSAVEMVDRGEVSRWCADGMLGSRAKTLVEHIYDTETGLRDVNQHPNYQLPPDFWLKQRLGNPEGDHWNSGNIQFNRGVAPRGMGMLVTEVSFYGIEVRQDTLRQLLNVGADGSSSAVKKSER